MQAISDLLIVPVILVAFYCLSILAIVLTWKYAPLPFGVRRWVGLWLAPDWAAATAIRLGRHPRRRCSKAGIKFAEAAVAASEIDEEIARRSTFWILMGSSGKTAAEKEKLSEAAAEEIERARPDLGGKIVELYCSRLSDLQLKRLLKHGPAHLRSTLKDERDSFIASTISECVGKANRRLALNRDKLMPSA